MYLKCEILLLVDVFEKFKNNSFENYRLSRSHYLSAPGFSWDSIRKMTKIKLGLIPHPDLLACYENGKMEVEFLIFLIDIAKPTINI